MSVSFYHENCIGCGRCVNVCPGNLIHICSDGKADIRDVKDCWGCASCLKECPVSAISMYLGADIGGNGNRLYVRENGSRLEWRFSYSDQSSEYDKVIVTDRKESNRY